MNLLGGPRSGHQRGTSAESPRSSGCGGGRGFVPSHSGSFKRLENLEKARGAGVDREKLGCDLDQLDRDTVNLRVPRSMASTYVEVRLPVPSAAL